jgi:hypothetical protein
MTRVTDEDFKKLVPQISNARGIIFDARGISLLSEHILGFFANKPLESFVWKVPIYTKPDHLQISYKTIRNKIELTTKEINSKVIFLCDERSIGYTESILELVKFFGIAEIIGKPTAGSPGEIIPVRLGAGYTASMTSILGYNPAGELMFGKSVEPTINIEYDIPEQSKTNSNIRNEITGSKGTQVDLNESKNDYDALLRKAISLLDQ